MRSLAHWLDRYALCHQNSANKIIHHICVPAIQFSLLGLLWLVRLPFPESWPYVVTNPAFVLVILAMIYYFMLSWRLTLGMLLLTAVMLLGVDLLFSFNVLLEASLSIFVIAWMGQFVGHMIEGKRPSFFEDIRFLLIGPLWVLTHLYTVLGLPIDKGGQQ
jgi:uncharacterized membrane protein YGL010W